VGACVRHVRLLPVQGWNAGVDCRAGRYIGQVLCERRVLEDLGAGELRSTAAADDHHDHDHDHDCSDHHDDSGVHRDDG
jgi:hypothetical protein